MPKERLEISASAIRTVDQRFIVFKNGQTIDLPECARAGAIRSGNKTQTCVAERKIDADPPFFAFFTDDHLRIIFDRSGLFSKVRNKKDFIRLEKRLNEMGYTTFDLS